MAERKYLKRISVENRIMLLLHDHHDRKDDYSVPEVLSQGGMSKEMDMRQNNISRSLQDLISKGFVRSRSAHVTGKQRRRKVYFLTEEGITFIDELSRSLLDTYIFVRTRKGDVEEWTLDRYISHLSRQMSRRFSIYETIFRYLDGNEADLSLERPSELPGHLLNPLPVTGDFYGREEELSILENMMDMKGPAMMLVIGIAGQGKTTLVSQFLKNHHITRFHWVPCNRWMKPLNFLIGCSTSLAPLSSKTLHTYLKGPSSTDTGTGVQALVKDLIESGMVLVLDDAHRMNQEMQDLMRLFKEILFSYGVPVKVIIMSRERPGFYSRTEVMVKERMLELELEGLDRNSAGDLLGSVNIPAEEHEMIYSLTNGHPLALSLLKASPDIDPRDLRNSLDRFLDEEILSSLSRAERSVLEMASVLEDPVKMDCFTSLTGVDIEVVARLRNRMLLRDYSDGSMDLHDAVKDTVTTSLSPEMTTHYQEIALDYYSKRSRDNDLLNHLHFCRKLGRIDETVKVLTDYGEYLLGKGDPLVSETLEDIMEQDLERSTRVKMLILVSEVRRTEGDEEGSKKALREAAVLCEDLYQSDEPEGMVLMSRILGRMAEVHLLEGVDRKGMETYKKGLKLVRKAGDTKEEGKILSNMGTAYLGLEEYDLALDHLKRAMEIYIDLDDIRGSNICRLNIGEVHQQKGELSNALKNYLETIRNSSREGLDRIQYQALYRTGNLYMMVMQADDAFIYLRSSLSGYVASGNVESSYKVLIQFVSSAMKSGKREEALKTLKRARRTLPRQEGLTGFFRSKRKSRSIEQYMDWIKLLMDLLGSQGPVYARKLLDLLMDIDKKRRIQIFIDMAYCTARDFKGPDRMLLNKVMDQKDLDPDLLIEARIMTAFTYEKGSDRWKAHLRKAMRHAKERKKLDQVDRIKMLLALI